MKQALLIIADPIEGLNYAGDSSLALAQGGLELGFRIFWSTAEHVSLLNGVPVLSTASEITHVFSDKMPEFQRVEFENRALSNFHRVLIRKDPPFDESYTDLCWILSQCAPNKVINSPTALLTHHEKLTPWRLAQEGIVPSHMMVPSMVSAQIAQLLKFASEQFSVASELLGQLSGLQEFKNFRFKLICKPWRGHAGHGVHAFDSVNAFEKWLSTQRANSKHADMLNDAWIVQPFLPELETHGDRRVFFINGRVAFDFVRRPAAGRIEANLAQGGSASLEEISEDVMLVCEKIATYLKTKGILIAGADFIGSRLTEVNITSPTGIRTYESLTAQNISAQLVADLCSKNTERD